MASKSRTLYIGVTGFLTSRVLQHKDEASGFAQKYRVNRLVYFESFRYVNHAIARETEIKKWRREKKVALIESNNPAWDDLAADWGRPITLEKQIPPFGRNDKDFEGLKVWPSLSLHPSTLLRISAAGSDAR